MTTETANGYFRHRDLSGASCPSDSYWRSGDAGFRCHLSSFGDKSEMSDTQEGQCTGNTQISWIGGTCETLTQNNNNHYPSDEMAVTQ